ncbi:MAG: hypothetical protein ACT4NU_09070 [Chromatiales bacterium]
MTRYILAAFLIMTTASIHADPPKIDRRSSGLYIQQFKNENLLYIVDPHAQLCFAATFGSGIIEIDCWALSRRPGWNTVVRWATPVPYSPEGHDPPPR